MSRAIVAFTAEAIDEIIANAGSQSWAVNKDRARKHEYLVCTRNAHNELTDGSERHGSAFLVGKISDVVVAPSPKRPNEIGRSMIKISEYAEIDVPKTWGGWRNPIRYTTLEALGIDPATLAFVPCESSMVDRL
jgi:hypothetical protein